MAQSIVVQPGPIIEEGERTFACHLKQIRQRLCGKQVWLSHAIGCSDAAISLWESGARLPNPRSLYQILTALTQNGASTSELLALRRTWHSEVIKKSMDAPLE